MSITLTEAAALQLVKTALESKSITLLGPNTKEGAPKCGAADSEYLKALIEGLTKQTP